MIIPETLLEESAQCIEELHKKFMFIVYNWWNLKSFYFYITLAIITVIILIKPQLLLLIVVFLLTIAIIKILLKLLIVLLESMTIIPYLLLAYCGKRYYRQFFSDGKEYYNITNHLNNKYAAVLISNAQSTSMIKCWVWRYWKNSLVDTATVFIPLLVIHFRKNKMNYKIVQSITKDDFDYHVMDSDCEELYLMGHGSRGRFKLSETIVDYSKYTDIKTKKRIVSQLHCNGTEHGKENLSLTELLAINQKDSFITKRNIALPDIVMYCWKMSRK